MKISRIVLIGAGYLGTIHAQKFSLVKGAKLAAVVDSDIEKATVLAEKYGVRAFRDCSKIDLNLV